MNIKINQKLKNQIENIKKNEIILYTIYDCDCNCDYKVPQNIKIEIERKPEFRVTYYTIQKVGE